MACFARAGKFGHHPPGLFRGEQGRRRLSGAGKYARGDGICTPRRRSLVGAQAVTLQTEPLSGSENFAFMLDAVPDSLLIGNGDAASGGHGVCMVNNPGYDFENANLPVGAAYWCLLTERFLVDDIQE